MAVGDQAGGSPRRPESAIGPYLRAIAARRVLVLAITLATVAASVAWLVLRSPTYEATAQILVTPLPQDDTTLVGVQVLRESSEPTRTTQTAANLITSRNAAELTAARLDNGWDATRVEDAVDVKPQGESNILAVTAQADDADLSARVANVYSESALEARRRALRRQVDAAIAQLRSQEPPDPSSGAATNRSERLSRLQQVRDGTDPTLSLSQRASVPGSPEGSPAWLVILLSAVAGLTLASVTALVLEALGRRIRDEDEMLYLYRLPVLARVPGGRSSLGAALDRKQPAVAEAFRSVKARLDRGSNQPRTVLVTSASSGDGRTTSAVNLAFSLAVAGHRVLLIDFDFRRPQLAAALGVRASHGLMPLLTSQAQLSDLLLHVPQAPLPMWVVPSSPADDTTFLEVHAAGIPRLLAHAKELADYVILDSSPLGEVSDSLRLVSHADEIIVVARPGHTDRAAFQLTRSIIWRAGRTPAGFLVIGKPRGGVSIPYQADGWGPPPQQQPDPRAEGDPLGSAPY